MAENKKTILIDLQLDTKKLVSGIEDARKSIKGLNSEVEGLRKTFSAYNNEIDNSAKKKKSVGEENEKQTKKEIEQTKQQIDAVNKKGKAEDDASKKQKDADALALQSAKELELAINQVGDTIDESIGASPRAKELITQLADTKKNIDLLTASNVTLKNGLKNVEVGSEAYNKINKALQGNEAQLKNLKGDYSNLSKELQNNIKENDASEGSYEQLYRRWTQADIALKNLKGTMKVNADGTVSLTAEYKKAKKEVDDLKTGLIKFGEGVKDGRLNVGNYTSSIKDAWGQLGLFGNVQAQVEGIIKKGNAGVAIAKAGYGLLGEGITKAKAAGESFSVKAGTWLNAVGGEQTTNAANSVSKVATSFTSTTDAIDKAGDKAKETGKDLTSMGKSGIESGKGMAIGTNIGANGMKLLKGAIAATGVGLLALAVAALIQWLTKFQAGMDLVRKVTAAAGAVINTIVNTFIKAGQAIANLDFGAFADAFTTAGERAGKAAKGAYELEQRKIKLEEAEIRAIKIQDEAQIKADRARLIAQDRTRTEEERIAAFKEASEQEKISLKSQIELAQERLAITTVEVEKKKKSGSITRELLKQQAEEEKALNDLKATLANKDLEYAKESARVRGKLAQERLSAESKALQNELTIAELGGKKNYAKRREIAIKEAEAAKAEAVGDARAIATIENDLQTKLTVIRFEAAQEAKQIEKDRQNTLAQAQKNRLALIVDERQRELALEKASLEDALRGIEKKDAASNALRQSLVEASAQKIREIEIKYAEQTLNEKLAKDKEFTDKQLKLREDNANQQLQDLQQQQANEITLMLQNGASVEEIEKKKNKQQRELANESLLIEQEKLLQMEMLQRASAATQTTQIEDTYAKEKAILDQQLTDKKLSQETYNAEVERLQKERDDKILKTSTDSSQALADLDTQIAQNKLQIQQTNNEQLIEDAQKTADKLKALDDQRVQNALSVVSAFKSIFETDTKNRKQYKDVLKALGIAEIWINTYKEIAGYWEGAGKDAGKTGLVTGAGVGASILAGVLTAGALARAFANTAKVSKNEAGGYTLDNAMKEYNPTYSANFKGGYVRTPTIWNLAGEKGTEYVAPNWQIRQNPTLFSSLEQWRQTGVKPFADGGFTTTTITAPLMNSMEMLTTAIATGFASAPNPIVSVQEINTIQNRVTTIESRASL